jgi:pimeloyl-ACP methyl ester carboxylesterase
MHESHVVTLQGQRLHYVAWSADAPAGTDLPPLIFLHGVTGHARTWDDEARALRTRYRVFALDQRGHGDSDPAPDGDYTTGTLADDLDAFVQALGLARITLVGLSMGGRVALAYAGRHPHGVERLVVVDIGPEIALAGRARVGAMMATAPERFASVDEAMALMRRANPRYGDALLRHRAEHGLRATAGGLTWKYDRELRDAVRQGRWRDPTDLWPLWAAIACPTLVVRGAESDILSKEIAGRMLAAQPRAQLVEIAEAGHTVPGDQPAAFLETLRSFLAR